MASVIFENKILGEPFVTWQLPVDVAQILDKGGIPHLLWGSASMKMLGLQIWDERIEFVVPDDCLKRGNALLKEAGFRKCLLPRTTKSSKECRQFEAGIYSPIAKTHYHIRPCDGDHKGTSHFAVVLHPKSSLLWSLPDIPVMNPKKDDPNYMLSTDKRAVDADIETKIPFFSLFDHPYKFKILTPKAHINALLTLRLRDWEQPNEYGNTWWAGIHAFNRYLVETGVMSKDDIEPRLQLVWDALHGPVKNPRTPMKLRKELLEIGELPQSPAI